MFQKKTKNSIKKIKILPFIYWLIIIILPIVLLYSLLNMNLPIPIIKLFIDNSIFGFLTILGLYGLCFRIQGKPGWLASLILTVVIFAAPLIYKWLSGYSDAAVIGSFIPYKDGFYYYNGARTLLLGSSISYGWNDVFRPLFPGLLASLLFLTGNNLLLTLTLIVLSMGLGCYLASRQVKEMFGTWPAALFMTLMATYSRRFIGYTWTELPSILLGCLAFILLLRGAKNQKIFDISLGAIVLTLALSIRAGAFFLLPLIAIWAGFAFRKNKKFDLKTSVVVTVFMCIAFILANLIVPKLLTAPGSSTFGNFAYTLYGQAKGGASWHQSIEDLQTIDTSIIMNEAIKLILHYPMGIIIGTVKAYRDFFVPNIFGIFNLISTNSEIENKLFWITNTGLLVWGIVYCYRYFKKPIFSLILSCFGGLLLSIPFVPPVGNGNRLFAGSIPFFFVLSAIGLMAIFSKNIPYIEKSETKKNVANNFIYVSSIFLLLLILVAPVMINIFGKTPNYIGAKCSESQIPFAIQIFQGSFVDITKDGNQVCGRVPNLCLSDFERNGIDQTTDDFFQILVEKARTSNNGIRIAESVDLLSSQYYFFIGTPDLLPEKNPQGLVMGCATKIENRFQKALWIDSILINPAIS
jgi:hypothetical protein